MGDLYAIRVESASQTTTAVGYRFRGEKVNGRRLKKGTTSKGKDSVSYKCVLSPRVAEIVHHHFLRAAAAPPPCPLARCSVTRSHTDCTRVFRSR